MQTPRTPALVATLDLSNEHQRLIHTFIQRTHTGRWPLWRSLGMRQVGLAIFEAVEWFPRRRGPSPKFSLLRWDIARLGVSWTDMASRTDALEALPATGQVGEDSQTRRHHRGVAAVSSLLVGQQKQRHHRGVTASSLKGTQAVVR